MHEIGSKALTTHWRGDQLVQEISRVEFWDFQFQVIFILISFFFLTLQQQTEPLKNVTIKSGDVLNLHCYYNSLLRTAPTVMSAASTDEMCLQMLYYYPALPNMPNCGFIRDESSNLNQTMCGFDSNRLNVVSASVSHRLIGL